MKKNNTIDRNNVYADHVNKNKNSRGNRQGYKYERETSANIKSGITSNQSEIMAENSNDIRWANKTQVIQKSQ